MGAQKEATLKAGGLWSGMSTDSAFAPTTGTFELLKNCYVTDDGSEIRRMPPLTLWADPILVDNARTITALTSGSMTRVTLSLAHRLAHTDATNPFGFRCYVTQSPVIEDGWYACVRDTSDTTLIILTPTEADTAGGTVYIERATTPHGMAMVGERLCIYSESLTTLVDDELDNHSRASIATWIQASPIDYTATVNPFIYWGNILNKPDTLTITDVDMLDATNGVPAILTLEHGYAVIGSVFKITLSGLAASGVPDGTYVATVTIPYVQAVLLNENQNGVTTTNGSGTVLDPAYHRPIRRRSHTEAADGRLLIAAPGQGVCYQAHVGFLDGNLAIPLTRALGVPKAVMVDCISTNDATGTLTPGFYAVAIAYKDSRTGEYGLISEREIVEVTAGHEAITVVYHTPRAVLRECYGCNVVFFVSDMASAANLVQEGTLKPTAEVTTVAAIVDVSASHIILKAGPTPRHVPVIENMPMGGSCICTVKGITFISGQIASSTSVLAPNYSIEPVLITTATDNNIDSDEITFYPTSSTIGGNLLGSMAADHQVPTSYGGMGFIFESNALAPLDKRINQGTDAGGSPAVSLYQRWKVASNHVEGASEGSTSGFLAMPRGEVWFSEQGHPGIFPSTNRVIVDRLKGYDVIGMGRMRDSLIACTDKETYSLSWGRSPLGTDPMCISTEVGCIGASTMVQYDGGLAWLSSRGPVTLSANGLRWEGHIAEKFDQYKRDSKGHMTHAFGAHDFTRKLILWFVRKDRNRLLYVNQESDDNKSKVPCDEVLVYSYTTGSFSIWELPQKYECYGACMVLCVDGLWRMGILTESKLVYLFDEDLNDTNDLVDVELITKKNAFANLERASKVSAVNVRKEGTVIPGTSKRPQTGYSVTCSLIDDNGAETKLSDGQQSTNMRTRLCGGTARAQELQMKLRFIGTGKLRIKDITLETSPGG